MEFRRSFPTPGQARTWCLACLPPPTLPSLVQTTTSFGRHKVPPPFHTLQAPGLCQLATSRLSLEGVSCDNAFSGNRAVDQIGLRETAGAAGCCPRGSRTICLQLPLKLMRGPLQNHPSVSPSSFPLQAHRGSHPWANQCRAQQPRASFFSYPLSMWGQVTRDSWSLFYVGKLGTGYRDQPPSLWPLLPLPADTLISQSPPMGSNFCLCALFT